MKTYKIRFDGLEVMEFQHPHMTDKQRADYAYKWAKAEGVGAAGITVTEKRQSGSQLQKRLEKLKK